MRYPLSLSFFSCFFSFLSTISIGFEATKLRKIGLEYVKFVNDVSIEQIKLLFIKKASPKWNIKYVDMGDDYYELWFSV